MKAVILVASGGAIGSVMRYLVAVWMKGPHSGLFPWHTFTVNIIGCFLIGLLFSWLAENPDAGQLQLFGMTGIIGGFTTYSSFGLESFELFRLGQGALAAIYIAATNIAGLTAVYSGYLIHQSMR